jgi:hypothetical protein
LAKTAGLSAFNTLVSLTSPYERWILRHCTLVLTSRLGTRTRPPARGPHVRKRPDRNAPPRPFFHRSPAVAYVIDYFNGKTVTTERWLGKLETAEAVARKVVADKMADRVAIKDKWGSVLFRYPPHA